MNKVLGNIFMLAVGATIGSAATWVYSQKKYSELIQVENEKTKEYYEKKYSGTTKDSEDTNVEETEEEKKEKEEQLGTVKNIIKESGYSESEYSDYTQYSRPDKHTEENLKIFEKDENIPVVIAPESYGDNEEYSMNEYTYYQDGVVTDEDGDIIDPEKVKALLGVDFASHIGDYEDDSVFIQNDITKAYYQILAEPYNYND